MDKDLEHSKKIFDFIARADSKGRVKLTKKEAAKLRKNSKKWVGITSDQI